MRLVYGPPSEQILYAAGKVELSPFKNLMFLLYELYITQ